MSEFVYLFSEGNKDLKSLLGGKGANLAEMKNIGLPVPEGFTITTEACNNYYEEGKKLKDSIKQEIFDKIGKLECMTGKNFGDNSNPLLVSVRSGAVVSMPGMMDTVLNLGLNDIAVDGLAKLTDNERFAYDSYRRFIQMFSDVVLSIHKYKFDAVLDNAKEERGYSNDTELTVEDLKKIINKYKAIVKKETGEDFSQEPKEQLLKAVEAVFDSWNNKRAITYRRINNIPNHYGTAVNVQSMVFGNMGEDSGTGVAFTRNPSTGENKVFGEFLMNAQGEDVVAGIRTPKSIDELKDVMPSVYSEFIDIAKKLENHYRETQDIEFTIEKGKLFLLQTRTGKRTAFAAVNIAVDMVNEGLIEKEEALLRIKPEQIDQLLHPTFDEKELAECKSIAKGLPASPGAASGKVYFTAEAVVKAIANGSKGILVRMETSPEDIEGMAVAEGVLTSRGGMTSHAAVVARGMGKCCIAGCGEINVDEKNRIFTVGEKVFKEGDYISLNGKTGDVYEGVIKTSKAHLSGSFAKIMELADEVRSLGIRTNADTPKDAQAAVEFGAEGIGLCRTEHMFFDEKRINYVRQMIVADDVLQRKKALAHLLPFQMEDFEGIFKAMMERPVTIRLLDPPLHEFLPKDEEEIRDLSAKIGVEFERLKEKVASLKEINPMLGHRGCRLSITYPEIYEMQVEAIAKAAINVKAQTGLNIKPEIMIPLVGHENEIKYNRELVIRTIDKVLAETGASLEYMIGTMIEVPRAAVTADEIAKYAEFFSFGTNDLTQMGFGFSRDDAGKFINEYVQKNIFECDPFAKLDQKGIGKLMTIAIELGRKTRPGIKLGICGEHGGEPDSIDFCYRIGLDYVSCSPYRVPIARLAAAQAVIRNR
ncbi:MAG: pyruvate, phosphate dikinase [Peptostreptococcaceae bacterium]|nr:pyruvate, phosphate dikinase [Peptostreptococcaceae bacterium]